MSGRQPAPMRRGVDDAAAHRREDDGRRARAASIERHPYAARPITLVCACLAVVLVFFSQRYGYHRDELYFRMLQPAWGYVDQPPLTPILADLTRLVADEPWALRIPSMLAVVSGVVIAASIARELGGTAAAQTIAATSFASTSAAMALGHVLSTASLDMLVWPLVCLLAMRALLRDEGRWWICAGAVAGASSYNKLLIVWLLLGIAVGLALLGPRKTLRSPALIAGCCAALGLALPNIIFQVTHGWPQLDMGAALAENNAAEVRRSMWMLLALVLGPPLVPIWVTGAVTFVRRETWRPARCLVGALMVVVALTFVAGAQPHYPAPLLAVLLAAGSVPVAEIAGRRRERRILLGAVLALNAGMSAVIALPVLPVEHLGKTPIPAINVVAADQVGWPTYVAQVVHAAEEHRATAVIASNYGEAGAVARFAPQLKVFSGHNALHDAGPPPEWAQSVVFVGDQVYAAQALFDTCEIVDDLDNGVDVDNEEQQAPIAACEGPLGGWSAVWPRLRHLD